MPFENLVSKRKKLLRFSLREKINRKVSSFSTSNLSISSRNSRQSQEEPTKKNDRRNSPRLRPISQFFFSRDEEDSLEECPEFSRSSSSTSTYSLQTPVTPSRASSRKRMSAIITSSDGSREDVRAAISIWKERVSELSACECGQSDCLSRFLLELNLAKDRPEMQKQRFSKSPSTKDTSMKKFILNELLETERSYNQLLHLIQSKYMQPMIQEASRSKYSLVKSSDIPLLFSHLPELLQLSNKLLAQFNEKPNQIGQVFKDVDSEFVVFLKYAIHYKTNMKSIRKACKNSLFIRIDQEILASRDTNRLGMSDYLIAPIQRIPRYCLLIKGTLLLLSNHDINL
ncbi:guanine nucleotide exchange factor DBS [Rhizopus azygosporus]|uniref:Guanine nucleotide exchange factor DBS n=1 Tax=Rhizopus azygosporus TaxID=86630 RepID=A0A367JU59_RHIAZ|nr:guanine nucleotide exchange factor DBS [Rhizopus azygosporus]